MLAARFMGTITDWCWWNGKILVGRRTAGRPAVCSRRKG